MYIYIYIPRYVNKYSPLYATGTRYVRGISVTLRPEFIVVTQTDLRTSQAQSTLIFCGDWAWLVLRSVWATTMNSGLRSAAEQTKRNKSGPRGSPCCTPTSDVMRNSPKQCKRCVGKIRKMAEFVKFGTLDIASNKHKNKKNVVPLAFSSL